MDHCVKVRTQLRIALEGLVYARLRAMENYKRSIQLKLIVKFVERIRTLRDSAQEIDSLIQKDRLKYAVYLHNESSKVLQDFDQFTCSKFLNLKLKDCRLKIDDRLDAILLRNCKEFDLVSYRKVQLVYEWLGSVQTIASQLQMHFVSQITRNTNSILHIYHKKSVTSNPFELIDSPESDFAELCSKLGVDQLVPCLKDLCSSFLQTLRSYLAILDWHSSRRAKLNEGTDEDSDEDSVPAPARHSDVETACAWHLYVVDKLEEGKLILWQEMVNRICSLLSAAKSSCHDAPFEHICFISKLTDG
ncbi:hypothetical protein Ciccas_000650 [Cichlidogyrus casuarinus]|uniref:Vacuolar protein sorting-associated protein 54 N-terminal domain-containing protein n=1 Tax=Cichlidogyrus casuarinus TaxID=1844966 RepID=A0ABD2QMB0_9PLAT